MPIGGGLLGAGSSLAGGIIGGNAAGAASEAAQQAAGEGNSILQGVQGQTNANLQPFVNTGQEANSALAGLLGIGGDPTAANNAFNNYLGSTNYQFTKNQGEQGIEYGNAGAYGSSATAKALDQYASGVAGSALQGYEGQLGGLSTQGVTAGSNLGQLGNQNAQAQSGNLLAAAGITGSADIYGANSEIGALRGITSGLSSFGSGGGFSGIQNLFGGGAGGGGGSSSFLGG